jgi:hypothetical protein
VTYMWRGNTPRPPACRSLVGDEGFGSRLPLAASGVGEPLGTAAGVLGLMTAWRAVYATSTADEFVR